MGRILIIFISGVVCLSGSAYSEGEYDHDYAKDPLKTTQLAFLEESLAESLSDILKEQHLDHTISSLTDLCSFYIDKYLEEFHQDTLLAVNEQVGIARAKLVTENPILVFKMIKRLYITIKRDLLKACQNNKYKVNEMILDTFKMSKLDLPIENDWNDALKGMIVIQFVYNLSSEDIRHGILNGTHTHATLYHDHCLDLAEKALDMQGHVMAYQWLQSALLSYKEQKLKEDFTEPDKVFEKLLDATKTESRTQLDEEMKNRKQDRLKGLSILKRHAPCRGEITMPRREQALLKCFLGQFVVPYFVLSPLKIEFLSMQQGVTLFHEFVGSKTIDIILKHSPKQEDLSSSRNITEIHPALVKLGQIIEMITGMKTDPWTADYFHKELHTPLGGYTNIECLRDTYLVKHEERDKLAALQIFLTNTKMGGYAAFEKLGTFAKPTKGSALLWYRPLRSKNISKDKKEEKDKTHVQCPVIMGLQQLATRWFLYSSQGICLWNEQVEEN